LVIDGPFSMFSASTKYGLQLAMIVPPLFLIVTATVTRKRASGGSEAEGGAVD